MKKWLEAWRGKKLGPMVLIGLFALVLLLSLFMGEGGTDAHTAQERRIGEVLGRIAGAGRVEVMIYEQNADGLLGGTSGTVGAVVVAEGADDLAVRLQLIRAVRTLLGLPETAVEVFEMGEVR